MSKIERKIKHAFAALGMLAGSFTPDASISQENVNKAALDAMRNNRAGAPTLVVDNPYDNQEIIFSSHNPLDLNTQLSPEHLQQAESLQPLNLISPTTEEMQRIVQTLFPEAEDIRRLPLRSGVMTLEMPRRNNTANEMPDTAMFVQDGSQLDQVLDQWYLPYIQALYQENPNANIQLVFDVIVSEGTIQGVHPRGVFAEEYQVEGNNQIVPHGTTFYYDENGGFHSGQISFRDGVFEVVHIDPTRVDAIQYATQLGTLRLNDGTQLIPPQPETAILVEKDRVTGRTVQVFTQDRAVFLVNLDTSGARIRPIPGTTNGEIRNASIHHPILYGDEQYEAQVYASLRNTNFTFDPQNNPIPRHPEYPLYAIINEGYTWIPFVYQTNEGGRGVAWSALIQGSRIEMGSPTPEPRRAGRFLENARFNEQGHLVLEEFYSVTRAEFQINGNQTSVTLFAPEGYFASRQINREIVGFHQDFSQRLANFIEENNLDTLEGKNLEIYFVGGVASFLNDGGIINRIRLGRNSSGTNIISSHGVGYELRNENLVIIRLYLAPHTILSGYPNDQFTNLNNLSIGIMDAITAAHFEIRNPHGFQPSDLIINGGSRWWKSIAEFVQQFPGHNIFSLN